MNATPSPEKVDERLAEMFALLKARGTAGVEITEAEAMEFARNAYFRGYMDSLRRPDERSKENVLQ